MSHKATRLVLVVILTVGSLGWSWPCGMYDWECHQRKEEETKKKEEARERKERRESFRKACSSYLAKKCSDKDVDEYRLGLLKRRQ